MRSALALPPASPISRRFIEVIVRRSCALLLATCLWTGIGLYGRAVVANEFSAEQIEFFEKQIRPLLVQHCFECHSAQSTKLQAELRVDFRDALLEGGDSGAAIVVGNADDSLLIHSIRYESYEMPPGGKLSDDEIALFERWIDDGAAWPDEPPPEITSSRDEFDLAQRAESHWAWQPLRATDPPTVNHTDWPTSPIDHYILRGLEDAGLKPAAPIDRRGLIRRLSFDLLGLPPSPEQVEAFVADSSPDAVQRLVDSMLESPHYGERWGRHWLDLVRYAESRGHEFDFDAVNAYQYRDYVIRAFNADVPYDQFVTEHLAGDLLDQPRLNEELGFNESILGTGFWFLGEWVHSPVDIRKDEADRFDNMIDVMSKTFLGLTVACARCHDHKFDAITTADYYALSGFLQSSDFRQVRFETIESDRAVSKRLAQLDSEHRSLITAAMTAALPEELKTEWLSLVEQTGRPDPAAPPVGRDDSDTLTATTPSDHAAAVIADPAVLVDYATIGEDDLIQDGFIFGRRTLRPGDLSLASASDGIKVRVNPQFAAGSDHFWDGLQSHSEHGVQHRGRLGDMATAGRTLRTPTVKVDNGNIAIRARGSGHVIACVDSHRLVLGPLHGETVVHFNSPEAWTWVGLNLNRYVGHDLHFEFVPDAGAILSIAVITQGASDQWKADFESRERARTDIATQLEHWFDSLQTRAAEPQSDETNNQDSNEDETAIINAIRAWSDARADLRTQVRFDSRLAMAMMDISGQDDRVLVRGSASNPGPAVPRRFLSAIDGENPIDRKTRSGRLELAMRINDPMNPQASRVIVNRIWHHLLGRGIVPTPDDFGVLGQMPTHPDLLDHLALQFLNDGRSIKRMIRSIVLSKTYQMSGQADPEAVAQDPKNLLWHHREPKRLDGEAIRDQLLALSGRLDPRPFGLSVPVHLTTFMEGRGRPGASGAADGDGRRSVYLAVRRNFLSPFMLAFDAPVPFSTMGKRNVSNVPAQSLILMNDPFVVDQATKWARRIIAEVSPESLAGSDDVAHARIRRMYETAFARPPSDQEAEVLVRFLDSKEQPDESRWADLAHALINTKEFIFLR
jgi:hypothetical protein